MKSNFYLFIIYFNMIDNNLIFHYNLFLKKNASYENLFFLLNLSIYSVIL